MNKGKKILLVLLGLSMPAMTPSTLEDAGVGVEMQSYIGTWVEGEGDTDVLMLIDEAFRSMHMASDMASLPLLYKRDWDGFVEAPYWPGWWIQNSFGPSYGMMPFLGEPYRTWIRHSQGLWFNMMGNGERTGMNGYVGPDGSLMDCAFLYMKGRAEEGFGDLRDRARTTDGDFDGTIAYEKAVYRQGDGNTREYDWYYGGAAAGLIMESERLLISRDSAEIAQRLPQLQRVAAFLDSTRDPETNLLKGGRSANLLAPSFGGVKQPDGTYARAYLTELSVNYCAGLHRLAALCAMAGMQYEAERYRDLSAQVSKALRVLTEPEGYFIRYMEEDGTRHGVFQADTFGYFEATPNHDAVAFAVMDKTQSQTIIGKILSIPELYPNDFILPNYPAYDDLDNPTVLKHLPHGMWVDGGFWSTTQGRMNIACMRVGAYDHVFDSWKKQLEFMRAFRAGSPMKDFGQKLWDDKLRKYGYNVVYDCWGVPGGLLRGMFEYNYRADRLELTPHLPANIHRYVQKHPVWFGDTEVYIAVHGIGSPTFATANGSACTIENGETVVLYPGGKPGTLYAEIFCGDAPTAGSRVPYAVTDTALVQPTESQTPPGFVVLPYRHVTLAHVHDFYRLLTSKGLQATYEGAMARLVLEHVRARNVRQQKLQEHNVYIPEIPGTPAAIEEDINNAFVKQAAFMTGGLIDHLSGKSYWRDPVDPEVLSIAVESGLLPKDR
jgi:hypothetical protein